MVIATATQCDAIWFNSVLIVPSPSLRKLYLCAKPTLQPTDGLTPRRSLYQHEIVGVGTEVVNGDSRISKGQRQQANQAAVCEGHSSLGNVYAAPRGLMHLHTIRREEVYERLGQQERNVFLSLHERTEREWVVAIVASVSVTAVAAGTAPSTTW